VFTRRMIRLSIIIIEAYQCYQFHINSIQCPPLKFKSMHRQNCWGPSLWVSCNISSNGQNSCIRQILEKKWEYNETEYQLFIDYKKVHDSVGREILYNIFIEFKVAMKLVKAN
jgi:hypothetical protein